MTKKILMMPDYRSDNPYQSLLAQELRSPSLKVCFPQGYRRIFPLSRAIQDNSADILHLHWLTPYLRGKNWFTSLFYSFKLLIDLWLIRLKGIKIVWTIHNHLAHNCQFPQLELWLRKRIANLVNEVIVHNHSATNCLAILDSNSQKLNIIPHGHYRQVYQPAIDSTEARRKLNLPIDGCLYLNLGMIRPYKGIEHLLQIWQQYQFLTIDSTLIIAGKPLDTAYGATISALATKTEKVILQADFIPPANMHLYFSAADVVVLPFTNILTSGSLILAMSYSKPIVAPCSEGIKETLQTANDLLYDPSDRQGLLKALKASTQIDLAELSSRVNLASDRLNWDKIARETARLY